MEVKVYFKNGAIETHRPPELAGSTTSVFDASKGRETGYNDLDRAQDIIERFYLGKGGYCMSREVVRRSDGGEVEIASNFSRCILPITQIDNVSRVLVDGEQVYPEEPADLEDVSPLVSDRGILGGF